jgi:hypothetical protein
MSDADLPRETVAVMIVLVLLIGLTALALSLRAITKDTLITRIRKE